MHMPRIVVVLSMLVSTVALADDTIDLAVGASKVITQPGLTRVAIGDPTVADVHTLGNSQLQIEGKGGGTTKMIIWSPSGRTEWTIVVSGPAPSQNAK